MKKIILGLLTVILISIIALIVVAIFNPFNLRTKLVGSIINSYLSNTIKDYTPLENVSESPVVADVENETAGTVEAAPEKSVTEDDKNPLLSAEQEKQLESYGVNVEQLPSRITPGMEACFTEILGKERVDQIIKGDSPSVIEFLKARDCLGK